MNNARSIVKCIHGFSQTHPRKTALIAEDGTVTYAQLWQRISACAQLLKQQGIAPGDRVLLEADHTVEFLSFCYGIHLCGAVHVPVERGTPADRIEEIRAEMGARLVLSGAHPAEHFGLRPEDLENQPPYEGDFPADESMLQEILFTTGTTGKSKGVMITHYAQMNMCQSQNRVLNFGFNTVWLIPTPMNHAAGLRKTHMSMVRGSTVLLMRGFTNLKLFFDNMRRHCVTAIYLPPAGVHYILTLASKQLAKFNDQLDFLYSSSAALPSGDKEKLIALLPDVRKFDAYGGSEVGAVCYIDYNARQGQTRCVGKPNPGVEITIVGEDLRPLDDPGPENPGIIAIRSNTVTAGYWNEPELTAQTILDGVIYMSDLGYFENGYLYLVGRRDDVINVGGYKIAPTEVEDVALRHPTVQDCVCLPYNDRLQGRIVKMCICLAEGASLDPEELRAFLGRYLEAYKIPAIMESVDSIPRTFNGKLNRRQAIADFSNLS